jgi:Flp pilus assembly protein TadD
MRKSALTLLPAVLLAAVACGCHRAQQAPPTDYQTVATDPRRDTDAARRLNGQAVALIAEGKLDEAEAGLKQALAADMFFGPAHNNLGTVYYRQKKFYLAAWEFQYAAKLMPTKAEPRNNLGMVYETVGKLDDAAKSYEEALQLESDASVIAGNLARVYVRTARNDEKTRRLLGDVALKDTRPEWVAWAREHLATMGQPKAPAPTIAPKPAPLRTDR